MAEVALARVAQTPVPLVGGAAVGLFGQAPLGGLHALHGAKLVKLRTRHHHLNEQLGLAHGELELHHAVVMLLHDADETLRHIPGGRGCGGRGRWLLGHAQVLCTACANVACKWPKYR